MGKSPTNYVHHGMNLREALAAAKALGCTVEPRRRTGELCVSHPSVPQRVLLNGRRKDAPRQLTAFLLLVQGFVVNVPTLSRKR